MYKPCKNRNMMVLCPYVFGVVIIVGVLITGCNVDAQRRAEAVSEPKPIVVGYGTGRFTIGDLLYRSDFDDPHRWKAQIQPRQGGNDGQIEFKNNQLHALMPGRGCTVWFTEKIHGPAAIVYHVVSPTDKKDTDTDAVRVRDINMFWMADGCPSAPDLCDVEQYSGRFGDYHKIHGYYASLGGRNNQTTRFRIYPRVVDGRTIEHLALDHRDGQEGYLINPNVTHTIQLVTFEDIVQFIVDGTIVYEIKQGDMVRVESRRDGQTVSTQRVYDTDTFPVYQNGYFGFRMVSTHHIFSSFRVYRLVPTACLAQDFEADH